MTDDGPTSNGPGARPRATEILRFQRDRLIRVLRDKPLDVVLDDAEVQRILLYCERVAAAIDAGVLPQSGDLRDRTQRRRSRVEAVEAYMLRVADSLAELIAASSESGLDIEFEFDLNTFVEPVFQVSGEAKRVEDYLLGLAPAQRVVLVGLRSGRTLEEVAAEANCDVATAQWLYEDHLDQMRRQMPSIAGEPS